MLIYTCGQQIKRISSEVNAIQRKLFCWVIEKLDHDRIDVFSAVGSFQRTNFIDEIEFWSRLFNTTVNALLPLLRLLVAIHIQQLWIVYLVEYSYLGVLLYQLTALIAYTTRNLEIMLRFCMGVNSWETEELSSALTNMNAFRYFLLQLLLFEPTGWSYLSVEAFLGNLHRNSSNI